MKKILIWLLAVVFIFSLTFIGVGCKEEVAPAEEVTEEEAAPAEEEEEEAEPEEEAEEEAGKPFEGRKIVIWNMPEPGPEEQALLDQFKEETGADVEYVVTAAGWADYLTKLATLLTTGSEDYDLYSVPEMPGRTYIEGGYFAPVDNFTPEEIADFGQAYMDAASILDGQVYLIPYSVYYLGLHIRKDWFDAEGLNPPTTWDELLEVGAALTKDTDGDGITDQWALSFSALGGGYLLNAISDFIWQAGGDLLDWNNPKTKDGLQFMYDLIHKYKIVSQEVINLTYGPESENYANDMYAMVQTWDGMVPLYKTFEDWYAPEKVYYIPMWKGPANDLTIQGASAMAIAATSKNQDVAKAFLKFIASKEAQIAMSGVRAPISASAYADLSMLADPDLAAATSKYVEQGFARLLGGEKQAELEAVLDPDFNAALAGQITVDEAIERTQQKIDEILAAE